MKKIFIFLFICSSILFSCEQQELETYELESKNNLTTTLETSNKTNGCTGVLNGFFQLCGFDRHGDQIEYNIYLTNLSNGEITGMPTWRTSNRHVQIVSTSRYSCKIRLKFNEDLANHVTTATIEATTATCNYAVPISINNCRDYSYSD